MATAAQMRELEQWMDHYAEQSAEADARTVAAVVAAYAGIDDWREPGQTVPAALAAVGTAQAARQFQAGLMAEFLRLSVEILGHGGRLNLPSGLGYNYPRSVDPFDVYSRPVYDARKELDRLAEEMAAEVVTEAEAILRAYDAATLRAESIALTDAALARREAVVAILSNVSTVTGYRRVIRPELSITGTCGLCIAAASQRYSVGDLMPIHTRCKCTVLPIFGDEDPATVFNQTDLDAAYAASPGTSRADLVKTRFRVEDTELGPTLIPWQPPEARQGIPGSKPHAVEAPDGFAGLTREQVELQIRITEGLKDSIWRTRQLARLHARLAEL